MASPGRSWIVLFWMGRKLIVLLQLLPFSSPHRERPALVLWPPRILGWACTPSCVGLEDVDQFGDSWCPHESRKARAAKGISELIQSDPLAAQMRKLSSWKISMILSGSWSQESFCVVLKFRLSGSLFRPISSLLVFELELEVTFLMQIDVYKRNFSSWTKGEK